MGKKKLVIPISKNKNNGQLTFSLPKKKLSKKALEEIMKDNSIHLTLEWGKFK